MDDIKTALGLMDHDDDDQWTAEGLPRLDTVAELMGVASVKRDAVSNAWPGFLRHGDGSEGTPPTDAEVAAELAEQGEDLPDSPEVEEYMREVLAAGTRPHIEELHREIEARAPDSGYNRTSVAKAMAKVAAAALVEAQAAAEEANAHLVVMAREARWAQDDLYRLATLDPHAESRNTRRYLESQQELREAGSRNGRAPIDAPRPRSRQVLGLKG